MAALLEALTLTAVMAVMLVLVGTKGNSNPCQLTPTFRPSLSERVKNNIPQYIVHYESAICTCTYMYMYMYNVHTHKTAVMYMNSCFCVPQHYEVDSNYCHTSPNYIIIHANILNFGLNIVYVHTYIHTYIHVHVLNPDQKTR